MESKAEKVDGFGYRPIKDFVYVAFLGQPDVSEGGIFLGSEAFIGKEERLFGRYQLSPWRFGLVVAKGPGCWRSAKRGGKSYFSAPPEVKLGDVVLFSRKHGSRLPEDYRVKVPQYETPLLVRVLDPEKTVAVVEDFTPWWDVEACQLNPAGTMTG